MTDIMHAINCPVCVGVMHPQNVNDDTLEPEPVGRLFWWKCRDCLTEATTKAQNYYEGV